MTISEKAAYLKGLIDGLGADKDTRDGKLWTCVSDLMADIASEIEDLKDQGLDFADTLDEIGDELSYLEEITCDLDSPEMFDDECYGNCEECGLCDYDEDDDIGDVVAFSDYADDEDDELPDGMPDELPEDDETEEDDEELEYDGVIYDVTCPACGEEISFDEDTLKKGSITCPKCGEVLEFELDEE